MEEEKKDIVAQPENIEPESSVPVTGSEIIKDKFAEKLECVIQQFKDCGDFEASIRLMLKELDSKIINKRFNPHVNSTTLIYDIMDDIQDWQSDMAKIFRKALKYKELSELLDATITDICLELEKKYLISSELKKIITERGFKNIDEKKAWIYGELNQKYNINEYVSYAKEQYTKSEYMLKQVNNVSELIGAQDAKVSRKISMIHEEVQMGLLKGVEAKI